MYEGGMKGEGVKKIFYIFSSCCSLYKRCVCCVFGFFVIFFLLFAIFLPLSRWYLIILMDFPYLAQFVGSL